MAYSYLREIGRESGRVTVVKLTLIAPMGEKRRRGKRRDAIPTTIRRDEVRRLKGERGRKTDF